MPPLRFRETITDGGNILQQGMFNIWCFGGKEIPLAGFKLWYSKQLLLNGYAPGTERRCGALKQDRLSSKHNKSWRLYIEVYLYCNLRWQCLLSPKTQLYLTFDWQFNENLSVIKQHKWRPRFSLSLSLNNCWTTSACLAPTFNQHAHWHLLLHHPSKTEIKTQI